MNRTTTSFPGASQCVTWSMTSFCGARSGVLRTQKLKSHLLRTQSSKVLPSRPGAGPYIALHATPTARDFFLANFYPFGPFTCIFSKTCIDFFSCASCG